MQYIIIRTCTPIAARYGAVIGTFVPLTSRNQLDVDAGTAPT